MMSNDLLSTGCLLLRLGFFSGFSINGWGQKGKTVATLFVIVVVPVIVVN